MNGYWTFFSPCQPSQVKYNWGFNKLLQHRTECERGQAAPLRSETCLTAIEFKFLLIFGITPLV